MSERLYRSVFYRNVTPRFLRMFGPVHVGLYRLFRGRIVGRLSQGFMPLLLLTTIGRKTGRPRTQPVGYVRDGSALIIVGSNAALTKDPGWVFNLRARPAADVELNADRVRVRATFLAGEEELSAWRLIMDRYSFFIAYRKSAGREIPLIRLDLEAAGGEGEPGTEPTSSSVGSAR